MRFLIKEIQTTNYTKPLTESLPLLGPKIWDIVPTELKEVKTLSAFKSGIKNW